MARDIELEEIDAWLAATDSPAADLANRAYLRAKAAHLRGERPKFMRAEWHHLPKDYRDFLVSFVKIGIDNAKHVEARE